MVAVVFVLLCLVGEEVVEFCFPMPLRLEVVAVVAVALVVQPNFVLLTLSAYSLRYLLICLTKLNKIEIKTKIFSDHKTIITL